MLPDRGTKLKGMDPDQPEPIMEKKEKRRGRVGIILVCILAVLAFAMSAMVLHVYLSGKHIRQSAAAPDLGALTLDEQPDEETENAQSEQQPLDTALQDENVVLVGEKRYRFNDEVQTFLLLGIDLDLPAYTDGSCNVYAFSDVVMLAAFDFLNDRISLIAVSRDTMCEFQRLNPDGTDRDHAYGQLALSFSYGDGRTKSCEITKNAVSQIMSGLPITSCSALYLRGLQDLNDAVGGVTVTILEDIDYGYRDMQKGAEVTLNGSMAEQYIRRREHTDQGNLKRMERQKQYIKALLKKVMQTVQQNPERVLEIYNSIKDEVVTDLTTGEILYLATAAAGMTISPEIQSVPGWIELSEDNFAQYYIDESGLLDLLLSIYYIECE